MTHDDALSLAMFWAGALMALAPLVIAAVVVIVVRRDRRARERGRAPGARGDEKAPGTP